MNDQAYKEKKKEKIDKSWKIQDKPKHVSIDLQRMIGFPHFLGENKIKNVSNLSWVTLDIRLL